MLDARSARSSSRRQAGFTLLEMIIVIAVLGMALGLVVTRGPMRSQTMEMQATVNQVAQGLRIARSRAIANNDIPLHSFRIESERPVALPRSVSIAMTAVSNETVESRLAAIRFYPDGSATGGRIDLAAGQRVAHIGVDWLTGKVSVQTR
jgi:general secretion pathway protein H